MSRPVASDGRARRVELTVPLGRRGDRLDQALAILLPDMSRAAIQRLVRALPVSDPLVRYASGLGRRSRPADRLATEEVKRWIAWGAGPRAAQALILAGKARALLAGRFAVTRADLRAVALPALRHRIIPNFRAEAEGIDADELVEFILGSTPSALARGSTRYDGRTRELLRL